LGWSTHVQVRLSGELIKNAELSDLVRRIAGRAPVAGTPVALADDRPFLIDNQPKSLTEVFKYFQNVLVNRVYLPNKPPHRGMNIPRHIIVGITKFQGDVIPFTSMVRQDKALMLEILYGQQKLGPVLEQMLKKVLRTNIRTANFALTDFEYGTLVFPQEDAKNAKSQAGAHCLLANIRCTIMVAWRLLNYYQLSRESAEGSTAAALRPDVLHDLQQLPLKYTNPFCRNLFLNHEGLLKLLPSNIVNDLKARL